MPADDGLWLHDDEDVGPAGPEAAQGGPEEPVQPIQTETGSFPLEHRYLLSKSPDRKGHVGSTLEEDTDDRERRGDEFGHELTLVTRRNTVSRRYQQSNASC